MPSSKLDQDPREAPWPKSSYAWYVTGVLAFAYFVSFVDRMILNLMVGPIKRDLNLTDTEMSLLLGLGFALFYATLGIPLARLADRTNRKAIITAGIFVWSFMTALTGLARSYSLLFLARIGVGIGEATLNPSAYSMMADYFPKDKLGRAMGVYGLGGTVGIGGALMLGGLVVGLVEGMENLNLPIIGEIYPWQLTFFVVGLPGVLLSALIWFTVKEPLRRSAVEGQPVGANVSLSDALRYMRSHGRAYAAIVLGLSFMGITALGSVTWMPTFFIRTHAWSAGHAGTILGLAMFSGGAGAIAGGWLGDMLMARGYKDAALRGSMVAILLSIIPTVAAFLSPNANTAVILWMIGNFLYTMPMPMGSAALQFMTPNRLRATVSAIFFFIFNLIALGAGPTLVALITDYGFADPGRVGHSLAIVAGISLPISALIFWSGIRAFSASMAHIAPPE